MTSSDEEVPSDLSSDDSLSTPPAQARRFLTSIHGPVELPPAVPRTGRTASTLLLTQAPGTGRTNPMNLPPTQQSRQSRNPDDTPPPGAANGPLAPTTTTSTRGRALVAMVRNSREGRYLVFPLPISFHLLFLQKSYWSTMRSSFFAILYMRY